MHTEEEAKTKWCPETRHTNKDENPANNKFHTVISPQSWNCCIGSQCMHWRWDDKSVRKATEGFDVKVVGYCGLSGKPK